MDDALKYDREDPSKEFEKAILWSLPGSRVLELGCHTGVLSAEFRKLNCLVTGVEINANALKRAEPFLNEALCLDLNDNTTWSQLSNYKFNIVTWIHVLEHLLDPEMALKKSMELLQQDGLVIIALPNISNARERFDMMFGKFEYEDIGVMDRTHIRFYNYITARRLIEKSGLEIIDYYSAWQTNPTRQFLRHLPIMHNLTRWMKEETPPSFPKYSCNLTDVTMMFKCRIKNPNG